MRSPCRVPVPRAATPAHPLADALHVQHAAAAAARAAAAAAVRFLDLVGDLLPPPHEVLHQQAGVVLHQQADALHM
jgi:hypothetical protein